MSNIFNLDSSFMKFLEKMTNLMIVNVLTLICSIPVITIGASYTAMYYTLLRVYRDETTYVTKDFFHAFVKNFKEATALWMIYLVFGIALGIDLHLLSIQGTQFAVIFTYAIYGVIFLLMVSLTWVFILLSRYENSIRRTIFNSFFVGIANFAKTMIMGLCMLAPYLLVIQYPVCMLFLIFMGISSFAYVQTMIFHRVFEKLEICMEDKE